MAGYRIASNSFINATTFNTQATRPDSGQRDVIEARNQAEGHRVKLGVGRNTSTTFPKFVAGEILQESIDHFLKLVEPSQNPDFVAQGGFDPTSMKTFDDLTNPASTTIIIQRDKPNIGEGPNLKTLDINSVVEGNIDAIDEQITSNVDKNSGFGWYDESHETTKIGSYFKNKYQYGTQTAEGDNGLVIKGERVDTNAINYDQ